MKRVALMDFNFSAASLRALDEPTELTAWGKPVAVILTPEQYAKLAETQRLVDAARPKPVTKPREKVVEPSPGTKRYAADPAYVKRGDKIEVLEVSLVKDPPHPDWVIRPVDATRELRPEDRYDRRPITPAPKPTKAEKPKGRR